MKIKSSGNGLVRLCSVVSCLVVAFTMSLAQAGDNTAKTPATTATKTIEKKMDVKTVAKKLDTEVKAKAETTTAKKMPVKPVTPPAEKTAKTADDTMGDMGMDDMPMPEDMPTFEDDMGTADEDVIE